MIKTLRLSDILIPPERLRELDEEKAQLMAVSVAEHGIFHPIAVYHSSRAQRPYTLIFGMHRHRAAEVAGLDEVPATIRNAAEAKALEIAENLFRNDLTTMERADFVAAWFKECGIKPGRPRKDKSANLADLFPNRVISENAAEQLGFSGRTSRRLRQIAEDLHPDLKNLFRGTSTANNQALLLKCARHGPDIQGKLVAAMREGASIEQALSLAKPPKPKADVATKAMKQFLAAWKAMDAGGRAAALRRIGVDRDAA